MEVWTNDVVECEAANREGGNTWRRSALGSTKGAFITCVLAVLWRPLPSNRRADDDPGGVGSFKTTILPVRERVGARISRSLVHTYIRRGPGPTLAARELQGK